MYHHQQLLKDKMILSECFYKLGKLTLSREISLEDNFRILKAYAKIAYEFAYRQMNHEVMDSITTAGILLGDYYDK